MHWHVFEKLRTLALWLLQLSKIDYCCRNYSSRGFQLSHSNQPQPKMLIKHTIFIEIIRLPTPYVLRFLLSVKKFNKISILKRPPTGIQNENVNRAFLLVAFITAVASKTIDAVSHRHGTMVHPARPAF